MAPVVSWFDSSSIRCWSTAGLSSALAVVLSLFSVYTDLFRKTKSGNFTRFLNHPLLFFLVIILTVTICRWWIVLFPQEVNPDETQMIAQAMKYLRDGPVPWLTVDGGTSGPLDSYVLVLPAFFGFSLGFATTRFVGLFCVIGTLTFTFLTLRAVFSDAAAKVAIMPMLLFYALARQSSYVHYSTEHLPVLFLSGALYFLVSYRLSERELKILLFLSGLALGAAPFAKLQAGPVAAALVPAGAAAIFMKHGSSPRGVLTGHMAALAGGVLAVPAVLLSMVLWSGAFNDFWQSYIVSGLYYSEETFVQPLPYVLRTLMQKGEFRRFIVAVLVAAFLCAAAGIAGGVPKKRLLKTLTAPLLYFSVTAYIVLKPSRPSFHYLLFLIPPVTLLAGSLLGSVADHFSGRNLRGAAAAILICSLALPTAYALPRVCDTIVNDADTREEVSLDSELIAPFLTSITRPDDRMAIWGWKPKYFVLTGLTPATREVYTAYQIMDTPLRGYYRSRFLIDLRTSRPAVFIDAVSSSGWGFAKRKKSGHETFKELADFIKGSYTLVGEFGVGPNDAIRIYWLNELLDGPAAPRS